MGYKRKENQSKVCASGRIHNPKPTTERGKRRHEERSEAAKQHAQKTWSKI